MAMKRGNSGHRPGGGIASRQRMEKPVKVGAGATEMRPAGVSQIVSSMGNRATNQGRTLPGAVEKVRGSALPAGLSVPLGNQVAAQTKAGPGGSRTVLRSGQQGTHGPVNPGLPRPASTGEIFPGFRGGKG
jgi:hypothetical protein